MARSQASAPNSPREKYSDRLQEKPEKQADGSKRSHHVRRKSGPREEKKRPSLSRRTTPKSSGRRDRDRDEAGRERDRDGGESFPQFCMTCEKQFLPANSTILYCSESCRLHDQAPASTRPQSFSAFPSLSPPASPYHQQHQLYFPSDGPDIIPRFSPTQVRPRSYFNNSSDSTYQTTTTTTSSSYHPSSSSHFDSSSKSTTASRSSTALASLRDLAAALPRSPQASPPRSPSAAVWSYIPFAHQQTKTATPTPSATPRGSYGSPHSYGAGMADYANSEDPFAGAAAARRSSAYVVGVSSGGMDRPLPPRSGPGGYGNRGRNIDLVTPFAAGW